MEMRSLPFALALVLAAPAYAQDPSSQPVDAPVDTKEKGEGGPFQYKPNRGFIFAPSESVELRFDALAQIQGSNDPELQEEIGSPVLPRRLRASLRGEVAERFRFKLGVDFAPLINLGGALAQEDDRDVLTDAWGEFKAGDPLVVKAGYFKTPFGRQQTNSSSELLLLNRAKASSALTFERGVGAMVSGDFKDETFEYEAGFTADLVLAGLLNVEPVPVATARFIVNPMGQLRNEEAPLKPAKDTRVSFGLNAALPVQSDNLTGNPTAGVDAALESGRFSFIAEVFARARRGETPVICQENDPTCDNVGNIDAGEVIGGTQNDQTQLQPGGYAQVGFLVVPKRFQLGGRVGFIGTDPHLSDGNGNGIFKDQGSKTELSAGANVFLMERRLMVQGLFSRLLEANNNSTNDSGQAESLFFVQLQAAL